MIENSMGKSPKKQHYNDKASNRLIEAGKMNDLMKDYLSKIRQEYK